MAQTIDILIRAKEMVGAGFRAAERKVKDFSAAMDNIGKSTAGLRSGLAGVATSAVALGAAVAAGMAKAVSAYMESEVAVNRLRSAHAAWGDEVENNIAREREFADALMKKTNVDDESIITSMADLRMMGMRTDALEDGAKAVIAMTRAGAGEEGAARMVMMAYQGQYERLARYIPALKTASSESEKAAIVNAFLSRQMQAQQAETGTLAGQWKALKINSAEALEKIGASIADSGVVQAGLKNISTWVDKIGAGISDWVSGGGLDVFVGTLRNMGSVLTMGLIDSSTVRAQKDEQERKATEVDPRVQLQARIMAQKSANDQMLAEEKRFAAEMERLKAKQTVTPTAPSVNIADVTVTPVAPSVNIADVTVTPAAPSVNIADVTVTPAAPSVNIADVTVTPAVSGEAIKAEVVARKDATAQSVAAEMEGAKRAHDERMAKIKAELAARIAANTGAGTGGEVAAVSVAGTDPAIAERANRIQTAKMVAAEQMKAEAARYEAERRAKEDGISFEETATAKVANLKIQGEIDAARQAHDARMKAIKDEADAVIEANKESNDEAAKAAKIEVEAAAKAAEIRIKSVESIVAMEEDLKRGKVKVEADIAKMEADRAEEEKKNRAAKGLDQARDFFQERAAQVDKWSEERKAGREGPRQFRERMKEEQAAARRKLDDEKKFVELTKLSTKKGLTLSKEQIAWLEDQKRLKEKEMLPANLAAIQAQRDDIQKQTRDAAKDLLAEQKQINAALLNLLALR